MSARFGAALMAALLGGAGLVTRGPAAAGPSDEGRPRPLGPGQEGPRIYFPLLPKGWLSAEVPLAQTAQARRATSTARAALTRTAEAPTTAPSATEGPTVEPSPTPTDTATPTATETPTPSDTPTPSATPLIGSPSPWPTPGGPTASPTVVLTPTSTSTARSAAAVATERLYPQAALAVGTAEVRFEPSSQTYRLRLRDASGSGGITWRVDPAHPDIAAGRLTVEETASDRYPMAGAGLYYRKAGGQLIEPRFFRLVGDVTGLTHAILPPAEGDGIRIEVTENLEGRAHRKRYTLRVRGRALEVRLQSLDGPVPPGMGGYAGIHAGDIEGTRDAVNVRLPGMEPVPLTMLDHQWFSATLLDYPRSAAGELQVRGPQIVGDSVSNAVDAFYPAASDGSLRAVDETLWVTLSTLPEDSFPLLDGPPSPHRPALEPLQHVTLQDGAAKGAFADWAAYVEQVHAWGLADLMVHLPSWAGPGALLPQQGPPDPARGGAAGFASLVRAAGGRLAPRLHYSATVASCPETFNPRYKVEDRVIGADGLPKPYGSFHCAGGADVARYVLPPNAAEGWMAQDAASLRGQGVLATALGPLIALNPGHPWPDLGDTPLDRAAEPRHPAGIAEAIAAYKRGLMALQRAGPTFGPGGPRAWESGFGGFYAGYLDAQEGALASGGPEQPGTDALMLPDYALNVRLPRQLAFGLGDYHDFLPDEDMALAAGRPLRQAEIDAYQASSLALGHSGAWRSLGRLADLEAGTDRLPAAEQVKAYWWGRAVATRLQQGSAYEVRYVLPEGASLDLAAALAADLNLAAPRLRVASRRDGDPLTLWVNFAAEPWPVSVGESSFLLPTDGWLAYQPGSLMAYSALVDGRRVDYLDAPEVRIRDGRGVGGDLTVAYPDGRTLVEGPDGRIEVSGP